MPLLALSLGWAGAADRPVFADPALGTGAAAFAGGGAGHVSGINAVFGNPGALYIDAGHQVELGMMGLSEGLSPYGLAGARSGPWTWALGYFYDERTGPFRNGVTAGAAREVAPGTVMGGAVKSQGGAYGFGVDLDAGILMRPRGWAALGDWAVLGLSARNLLESGLGQEPEGYETLRSYSLSFGARRDAARFLFIPVREPDASYELGAAGLSLDGLSHTFSAGAAFTPAGTVTLRATLRMPHEGSAVIAFGGFVNLLVGAGGLRCGYTFATGAVEGAAGSAPTHSFSINMALGTRSDRQPPWVAVQADRTFLGAEAPGHDRVHFRLRAADRSAVGSGAEGGDDFPPPGQDGFDEAKAPGEEAAGGRGELKEWTLTIVSTDGQGRKGEAVMTFQGKDLPPRLIRWDGRDGKGAALAPGYYAYRLSALDRAGNRSSTAWQLVELGQGVPAPAAAPQAAPGGASEAEGGESAPATEPSLPPIIEGDDG